MYLCIYLMVEGKFVCGTVAYSREMAAVRFPFQYLKEKPTSARTALPSLGIELTFSARFTARPSAGIYTIRSYYVLLYIRFFFFLLLILSHNQGSPYYVYTGRRRRPV